MSIIIFLLFMSICLGLIYLVHKYYRKEHFYLLGIIYSIIGFIMSFKIIHIFGLDINASVIFTSGIIVILYYFVNRYHDRESRKFIYTILLSSLMCICLLLTTVFMVPSLYDKMSLFYESLVFENLAIVILYPISQAVTLFLSEYCFREFEKETSHKNLKMLLTLIGITFIDTAIFIYFSYAFIIRYDTAIKILIDNYLIKTIILTIYIFTVNKLFNVKKVK